MLAPLVHMYYVTLLNFYLVIFYQSSTLINAQVSNYYNIVHNCTLMCHIHDIVPMNDDI